MKKCKKIFIAWSIIIIWFLINKHMNENELPDDDFTFVEILTLIVAWLSLSWLLYWIYYLSLIDV